MWFFFLFYTFAACFEITQLVSSASLSIVPRFAAPVQTGRLTEFRLVLCVPLGAMQTPEAGADSTSTVPLQTSVPVQPPGSTQQVPVQPQVLPPPQHPRPRRMVGPS